MPTSQVFQLFLINSLKVAVIQHSRRMTGCDLLSYAVPDLDSVSLVLNMFTLCMSRGYPSLQNAQHQNNAKTKQVKGGYLLRYRRGLFCKKWCEEWFVLYEDSTLAWFADKGLSRPRGRIRISETPELLAVGEWTRQVPRKPLLPHSCHISQLLAIGSKISHDVHWLMAQSSAEVIDWMTAINKTLPLPLHQPLEKKGLLEMSEKEKNKFNRPTRISNNLFNNQNGSNCVSCLHTSPKSCKIRHYNSDIDHTVLSGVVIDWGHGWGWGENAWSLHSAGVNEAATNPTIYCPSLGDYAVSGYDEMDCSAFGDFIF